MSKASYAVFRMVITAFTCVSLISACNSSNSSSPAGYEVAEGSAGGEVVNDDSAGAIADGGPNTPVTEPTMQGFTRVNFDITVPKYVSDALQVQLVWGQSELNAKWVVDESWTITHDLPKNTENLLTVTFSDDNGAVPLAQFAKPYTTGSDAAESYQINAAQFDTSGWDHDSDGVSNLDELIAGTYLLSNSVGDGVPASLELIADKTLRIRWQPSSGTQYYRVLEKLDHQAGFTQISSDLPAETTSFDHRIALYSAVNARYLVQSCQASDCVASDELQLLGSINDAVVYFKPNVTDANGVGSEWEKTVGDRFGFAVSLSADGETLVIGAPLEDSAATGVDGNQNDNSAINSGAVYVFARINGAWQQQAYLKGSNTEEAAWFGMALSLTADGDVLAVGAPRDGAVYLFERSAGRWQEQTVIDFNGDWFGRSVSLSADGSTLAVGASADDSGAIGVDGNEFDNTVANSGAVHVYTQTDDNWRRQAFLKGSHLNHFDHFGTSVSLSATGNTLAIGSPDEDSRDNGQAYVFERTDGVWQQQLCLSADKINECAAGYGGIRYGGDQYGIAVSLSADGNTLAVGSSYDHSPATGVNTVAAGSSFNSGAAFVYERNSGNWQKHSRIKASNTGSHDSFGASVSLSANGKILAVGAPFEQSTVSGINGNEDNDYTYEVKPGAAYVFVNPDGNWQQQAYVKASNTDQEDFSGVFDEIDWSTGDGEEFGYSVQLSGNGDTLAVGATEEQSDATGVNGNQADNSIPAAGAVYLY